MTWTRLHNPTAMCLLVTAGITACNGDSGRGGGGACVDLLPGDLVITEIMANPAGEDAGKEWFEVYNATAEEVDLSGVVLRARKSDGSGEKLHKVEGAVIGPGAYMVFGNTEPDVLPPHVDYGYGPAFGENFNNSAGQLALGCGEVVFDAVAYDQVIEDVARTFDGTRTPDALGNDDLEAWCDAITEYEPGLLGTPGEPNDPCYSSMPTSCLEGGVARDVRRPGLGDIVITEYMANPDGYTDPDGDESKDIEVLDDDGEWFEIYVNADVDLNGLSITKVGDEEPSDIIGSVDCLAATAGSHFLFAHSSDATINGGLPPVDYEFTMPMTNSPGEDGTGFTVGWGGEPLDTVTWMDSPTGASNQLDPAFLDPTANDAEDAFCEAEFPYGVGDFGTPGEANPRCPFEGSCIEDRDRRAVVAPKVGDLWITEFLADPDAVAEGDGEWFEVFTNADFDLNALAFGRAEDIEVTVDRVECTPVEAGQYLLFARNGDTNASTLPFTDYEVEMSLVNDAGGALFVATMAGEVLDAVAWSTTTAGSSRALDPSLTGPDANDDEGNWCDGADAYGAGDFGTPGAENSACGGTPVGTCDDGGNVRDVVAPGAGDLVITEWMPDPSEVGDTAGEWFEVLVNANVDLNGLQLGNDSADPDTTLPTTGDCIAVAAGTRVVFARNADAMTNGGISNAIEASFSLTNSTGALFVGHGDVVIDEISYTSVSAGSSTSVVPGSEDAVSNDDEGNHCTSNTPYGDGDNGTPGAANACG